jgi:sialic acid synthase SpsE
LDPDELKEMVNSIRNIEKALGNGIKVPNNSELLIQDVVKKKIVASEFIAKGEEFSDNNLTVKRVNDGISAAYWDFIIGMKAIHDFNIDDPILIK